MLLMTAYPSLKRWLAAGLTLALLAGAVFFLTRNRGDNTNPIVAPVGAQGKKASDQDWIMYGGTPARNMVNLAAKGLPDRWTDKDGELIPQQILWVAKLGSKSYGGPIVADGRVFIGTNNMDPRDKK